jgi:hypothetical protein
MNQAEPGAFPILDPMWGSMHEASNGDELLNIITSSLDGHGYVGGAIVQSIRDRMKDYCCEYGGIPYEKMDSRYLALTASFAIGILYVIPNLFTIF